MSFADIELTRLHETHSNLCNPSVYYIRDTLAYCLILQEVEEEAGRKPIISFDKLLLAVATSDPRDLQNTINQLIMAGYFRQDDIADFDKGVLSLTEQAKIEIKEAFNDDKHAYKLDKFMPGIKVLGQSFSMRMNKNFGDKPASSDNLAMVVAQSIKSSLPKIQMAELNFNDVNISGVRLSVKEQWETGIIVVRNEGTLSAENFFKTGFLAQGNFPQTPFLMIYPSIEREQAEVVNTQSPYLYGMSELGTLRFLNLLANMVEKHTANRDKLAQNFMTIYDIKDCDEPQNDKKTIRKRFEYSPPHAVCKLEKSLSA